MALVTQKAGVAVGDLSRTQDSSANRMKQFRAGIQSLKENFAVLVTKALAPVIDWLGRMGQKFQEWGPKLHAWGKKAGEVFKPLLIGLKAVGDTVKAVFSGIWDIIQAHIPVFEGTKGLGSLTTTLGVVVKAFS